MLLDNGIRLHKIGAQIPDRWTDPKQVQGASSSVLREPDKWPAQEYIASTIHVVRKFMGTASQTGNHELWAEIGLDNGIAERQDPNDINRLLILDGFRDDRESAEIIRTARALAWDAGMMSHSPKADPYSPEAFRASRLQTLMFPLHQPNGISFYAARLKAEEWGCKLIFLRPLPDSELDKAEVGRPHFWKMSGEPVDLEEIKGQKIALVVSQSDQDGKCVQEHDICLSIQLSISPSSPYKELPTLPAANAAALAMSSILSATQGTPLAQPSGLKMSHSEFNEGRMVTKEMAKVLNIRRPLSEKQQRMKEKRRAQEAFEKAWEEAEIGEAIDDNLEGREEEEEVDEEQMKGELSELKLKEHAEWDTRGGTRRATRLERQFRDPNLYVKGSKVNI
jgi:tRNA G18 (ribose-2'-O)-methylase SpoU